MASESNPVILIPARMASTRLPDKPLADIHGAPMIVHVWRRAVDADLGPVYVACDSPDIAGAIEAVGGHAVLTDADLASGSDRIQAALEKIDPEGRHDVVINLQGDLPTIAPETVRAVLTPLADPAVDIATLVCEITTDQERADPNVVKAVVSLGPGEICARALYFSRVPVPSGGGPLYHHIGLYAYRRTALRAFVSFAPGIVERRERLEQLRALEHGLRIDAALVDTAPLGVDTPGDLDQARALLSP